jgi:serine/threonine protein kinase/tetratricopeptide (TPR) repeat protein
MGPNNNRPTNEVRLLFEEAVRFDPASRHVVLDAVSDSGVRDRVETLLDLYEQASQQESLDGGDAWAVVTRLASREAAKDRRRRGPDADRLLRLAPNARPRSRSATASPSGHASQNLVAGRYRIDERIGAGGMGEVFRATDVELGRNVALKYLLGHTADDLAVERFMKEARLAAGLDHPNIGYIHEVSRDGEGRLFIAMAYYEGQTLRARLEEGPLPVDEAVHIAQCVAAGLAHAHRAGVVHRDVNPANILLTKDDGVRIIDFGVATTAEVHTITQPGARVGTAAYLSPEQAQGTDVDGQTDVWALGVVLYEMLAGERPFSAAYEAALVYEILHTTPPSLSTVRSDVPQHVSELVDSCLEKDPSARCASASAVIEALDISEGKGAGVTTLLRPSLIQKVAALSLTVGAIFLAFSLISKPSVERHLVVLPFEVFGAPGDNAILAAGLQETLTSRLTHLQQIDPSLWVLPARDVGSVKTPEEARHQLGATMVVGGSVQYEADRVRITLNIIDTRTRRQIDSEQIDRAIGSSLALQDEAAVTLAGMLQLRLGEESRQALHAGSSTDPEANALYIRGWGYLRDQQSLSEVEAAVAHFEQALEIDPSFVNAHAALAEGYWHKYRLTEDVAWAERAIDRGEFAMEVGGEAPAVLITLGMIRTGTGEPELAMALLDRALEHEPANTEALRRRANVHRRLGASASAEADHRRSISLKPDYWGGYNSLGVFLYQEGRYDEALDAYERGLRSAPGNSTLLVNSAVAHWQLERIEEAVVLLERVLAIQPDHVFARSNLGTAYFYTGRYEEAVTIYSAEAASRPGDFSIHGYLGDAYSQIRNHRADANMAYRQAIRAAKTHLEVRPGDATVIGSLAWYYARLGEADSARAHLDQISHESAPQEVEPAVAFGIGEIYEHLGERETALEWMLPALDRGHGQMQLRRSPWLESLRSDSRVGHHLTPHPRSNR